MTTEQEFLKQLDELFRGDVLNLEEIRANFLTASAMISTRRKELTEKHD